MATNITHNDMGAIGRRTISKKNQSQLLPQTQEMPQRLDEDIVQFPQSWQRSVLKKFYYDRTDWIDGTTEFHNLVAESVERGVSILEVGAGRPNKTTAFFAGLGDVTGIDIAPEVCENHYCKETIVYDGVRIPRSSAKYDAVVSNYVCEHIEHPLELTREIHRVLKPGGIYLFKTPNIYHYVTLISKLSPRWFQTIAANRLRNLSGEQPELYKTYYRMNTAKTCRGILSQSGFTIVALKHIEKEPSYAMASRLMFYPLMIWERVINSINALEHLRSNIICAARADA